MFLLCCSSGADRTGTYIAIDSLMTQMAEENTINVFDFTFSMREQRIHMIQTQVIESSHCFILHCNLFRRQD